jgi:NAD kinase
MLFEKAIIIRDKTRLEQLIDRFNSKAQARFYIERNGGDFDFYEAEHETFYKSLETVKSGTATCLKYKVLDRSFLSTYLFSKTDLIIVLGQDGLVANTAKYVCGQPIIAVNPDPEKYDGILLPYHPENIIQVLTNITKHKNHKIRQITMAEARLSDNQRMLAFNDFYIGSSSHVSSRYSIMFDGKREDQSSSGIIISTGAGSTGWLSSIFNMVQNVNNSSHGATDTNHLKIDWESNKLIFVVREPFRSHMTQTDIGFGIITKNKPLTISSSITTGGVIFSDGIEADFLSFNSGNTVCIGIAKEKANLVAG